MRKSLLLLLIVLVFGVDTIAQAQQTKVFRIGFLGSFESPLTEHSYKAYAISVM